MSVAKSFFVACLRRLHLLGPLRRIRESVRLVRRVWRCKRNYARVLKRLRAKPRNEKIRVLFLCGDPAKWKCQKLYEAMRGSKEFEPLVGLTAWNMQSAAMCPDDKLDGFHCEAERFFDKLGVTHVRTYSLHPRRQIDLSTFSPDLVFYSEPWSPVKSQTPEPISRFALAFFIPYFTPSHGDVKWEARQELHRFLYTYITLNDRWAKVFRSGVHPWTFAATFVGLGHPSLDFFQDNLSTTNHRWGVVYAPHYSFPAANPHTNYGYIYPFSTFDRNGEAILAYAQSHPDFGWVFKPHPVLRRYLVESGLWTKEKTDAYYTAWERLGRVCYDGDYQNLFLESRALVTDCCSFLTEYGATGKPIIHLLREDTGVVPLPPSKTVFETFYQVHDLEEMFSTFKTVLEDNLDPKQEERLSAVREAQIVGVNASANIVKFLRTLLRR